VPKYEVTVLVTRQYEITYEVEADNDKGALDDAVDATYSDFLYFGDIVDDYAEIISYEALGAGE
jgi:hypothetical protein